MILYVNGESEGWLMFICGGRVSPENTTLAHRFILHNRYYEGHLLHIRTVNYSKAQYIIDPHPNPYCETDLWSKKKKYNLIKMLKLS